MPKPSWPCRPLPGPIDRRFRIHSERPPLDPLEAALVGVTSLHLCFLPWAFGAAHAWSQLTSLGLSIIGFVLASLPRRDDRNPQIANTVALWPTRSLPLFPIFWAGLAMLGYVAIQGLNPAWRFTTDGESWWLRPLAHVAWLPSGVDAPFARSNPWRALAVGLSLWLLVCSVSAGFLRRKSFRALFTVVAGNAFLVALLGVAQKLAGADGIFWSYRPSNDKFMASFIYPNHAGTYFNLMVGLAIGLAWAHYRRAQRCGGNIARARVLTLLAVFIGVATIFSGSRASVALLLIFAGTVGSVVILRRFRHERGNVEHRDFLPFTLIVAVALGVAVVSWHSEKLWGRFSLLARDPAALGHDRALSRAAAADMLHERWMLGWGGGCFRYGFPLYVQKYPEIYLSADGGRKYWEHVHNDWLEFPIELGAVGILPALVILAWAIRELIRRRFWCNALSLSIVLGCTLTTVHAGVDFVFQNPAVLLTWAVLLIGAIRWAELDQFLGRGSANSGDAGG